MDVIMLLGIVAIVGIMLICFVVETTHESNYFVIGFGILIAVLCLIGIPAFYYS